MKPKLREIRLHWISVVALTGLLALFVWLNLEAGSKAYMARDQSGWRGGLRLGCPLVCWDAGKQATVECRAGNAVLRWRPYGGIQWLGLAANLAIFGVVAAALLAGCEHCLRRGRPRRWARKPARAIHPATALLALAVAGALVWVNLQLETEFDGAPNGGTVAWQHMGWPLTIYRACNPDLEFWLKNRTSPPSAEEYRAHIEARPNLRWCLAHYFAENIALNLALGVLAILLAATASERFRRKLDEKRLAARQLSS